MAMMRGAGLRGETRPVDIVYTWVDDGWPGYRELLGAYAKRPVDSDPSRTRDNLELLRFSLRSVERFASWVRNIHVLTCRPQIPAWLNHEHPQVRIVHHDEIMDPAHLPTFSSLAIISHLHLIPGLSENFIYLEDDMVLRAPLAPEDLCDSGGRLLVFPWHHETPTWESIVSPEHERPWNLALAESNRLLDRSFGAQQRKQLCHTPLLINARKWAALMERFSEGVSSTRTSRFRERGNVAPEFIYPWMMLADGEATLLPQAEAARRSGYVPLENFWPATLWFLFKAWWHKAAWITFNDNLLANPSRVTEAMVRSQLQAWFPDASRFER